MNAAVPILTKIEHIELDFVTGLIVKRPGNRVQTLCWRSWDVGWNCPFRLASSRAALASRPDCQPSAGWFWQTPPRKVW